MVWTESCAACALCCHQHRPGKPPSQSQPRSMQRAHSRDLRARGSFTLASGLSGWGVNWAHFALSCLKCQNLKCEKWDLFQICCIISICTEFAAFWWKMHPLWTHCWKKLKWSWCQRAVLWEQPSNAPPCWLVSYIYTHLWHRKNQTQTWNCNVATVLSIHWNNIKIKILPNHS